MSFDGKRALITGASGSIGQAIARRFASAGAKVAVHYNRSRTAADQLIAELDGEGHIAVGADMGDGASVQRLVDAAIDGLGGLDVLVNNAGIDLKHAVAEVDYEEWQRAWQQVTAINLIGTANASYCAARHMMRHGGGRIVNVSSRGAYRGEPEHTSYGASKAGMSALSQSLAKELGPFGIYVTAVAPGWVEGGMADQVLKSEDNETIRAVMAQSPLGRVARPDEVAHTVLFLASEGAEFLTGAVVDINGASYLR
jgi:NAD(P)-dependent dehydrogenase (short-subunit alcohol dehydrogenase family)